MSMLLNPYRFATAGLTPPVYVADHTTWWADDVTVSNGSDVGAAGDWPARQDDLGLGDLVQTNTSNRPVFASSDLGSRPTVNFDGVSEYLLGANTITGITTKTTYIIVCRLNSGASGTNIFMASNGSGAASNARNLYTGSGEYRINAGTVRGGGTPDLNAHLLVADFDGGVGVDTLDEDGTNIISADAGARTFDNISIAANNGGLNDTDMSVCLVQIISGGFDTGELAELETFVSDYYGITIA